MRKADTGVNVGYAIVFEAVQVIERQRELNLNNLNTLPPHFN